MFEPKSGSARLVCLVCVAPLRPPGFVLFRIGKHVVASRFGWTSNRDRRAVSHEGLQEDRSSASSHVAIIATRQS